MSMSMTSWIYNKQELLHYVFIMRCFPALRRQDQYHTISITISRLGHNVRCMRPVCMQLHSCFTLPSPLQQQCCERRAQLWKISVLTSYFIKTVIWFYEGAVTMLLPWHTRFWPRSSYYFKSEISKPFMIFLAHVLKRSSGWMPFGHPPGQGKNWFRWKLACW